MRQEHKEEAVEIFRRLVAAKRSGSLMASGRAYTDLNMLADYVAGPERRHEMRKVIQLIATPEDEYSHKTLRALCDDGTMWFYIIRNGVEDDGSIWHKYPNIPQDNADR